MYITKDGRLAGDRRPNSVQVLEDVAIAVVVFCPTGATAIEQAHCLQQGVRIVSRVIFVEPFQDDDHVRIPHLPPELLVANILDKHSVHEKYKFVQSR